MENIKRLESRINSFETSVTTVLRDLKKLIEDKDKRSFSIKQSDYEVTITTIVIANYHL